jgi:hypothetical protein
MLFVDGALFAEFDSRLEQRVNPPIKEPRVILPTKPWESWAVFAYNHVLSFSATEKRMYYDCIAGTGVPPGASNSDELTGTGISHRRICLATSKDGLTWTKPSLGIFNLNGSTANNILVEDSGVSVFKDGTKDVPDSERWKMVCSNSAYASPDGLRWKKLAWTKVAADDTKPTAYYDPSLKKYVVVNRRDVKVDGKSGSVVRQVGRCVTDDITNWQKEVKGGGGCDIVFGPDALDPDLLDVYTNAYTPYPSIEQPAVHLLFPSFYHHFGRQPFGFGNDGLLDIRLVVSRDGIHYNYTSARNARAPFVPLGE